MFNWLIIFNLNFILFPILFIFGLIFGSFFNVIVHRFGQKNKSWFKGRSSCDACQHQIAWYDNIPLFSYVMLQAKCRHCHTKISLVHPVVEFLTGVLFCWAGLVAVNSSFLVGLSLFIALPFSLTVFSILWLILLFDLKYGIIPDELSFLILVLAVFKYVMQLKWLNFTLSSFMFELVLAVGLFLFFLSLREVPKRLWNKAGMGWGDIKLIFPLALLLGFPQVLIAVFCAFIIGGVWGIILLVTNHKKFGQTLAFGPFLVIGSLIALTYGTLIWQWYWQLL